MTCKSLKMAEAFETPPMEARRRSKGLRGSLTGRTPQQDERKRVTSAVKKLAFQAPPRAPLSDAMPCTSRYVPVKPKLSLSSCSSTIQRSGRVPRTASFGRLLQHLCMIGPAIHKSGQVRSDGVSHVHVCYSYFSGGACTKYQIILCPLSYQSSPE